MFATVHRVFHQSDFSPTGGVHQAEETLTFMSRCEQIKAVWTLPKTLFYYFGQETNLLSDQDNSLLCQHP